MVSTTKQEQAEAPPAPPPLVQAANSTHKQHIVASYKAVRIGKYIFSVICYFLTLQSRRALLLLAFRYPHHNHTFPYFIILSTTFSVS